MMDAALPLGRDAFGVLCGLFRARLGGGAAPAGLCDVLRDPGFDWAALLGCADRHAVVPALAAVLEDLQLGPLAPAGFIDFIADIRAKNAARNRALRAQLLEVVRLLNGIGIEPVLLKGAIRLVDDLYPDSSWRYMVDLDLLIADGAHEADRALQAAGYRPPPAPGVVDLPLERDVHHHLAPLKRDDRLGTVELHVNLANEWHRRVLPAGHFAEAATAAVVEGVRLRIPDRRDQLMHGIMHRQLNHDGLATSRFDVRDAIETRLLLEAIGRAGWVRTLAPFDAAGYRLAPRIWLAAVQRAMGGPEVIEHPPSLPVRLGVRRMVWQERQPMARQLSRLFSYFRLRLLGIAKSPRERRRIWRSLGRASFWRQRLAVLRKVARAGR